MSVQWTGLTAHLTKVKKIGKEAPEKIAGMTSDLFDIGLSYYTDNLSGGGPSSNSSPLPVGIESGDLIGHAEDDSKMLNQFAFEIKNDSAHAGFIEYGTIKMVARAPLQDAINRLEEYLSLAVDSTMDSIMSV